MSSGTQDISLSSPWDSRHQQHSTTSHHHSSVPQLHGTQDTSNTSQLHTTTHQSLNSMGLRHQQHSTTSHHHSSVPQLHGTQTPATLHNFTPPLISPSTPWDSDTSNTPQLHTTTHQSLNSMGLRHQQHSTTSHHHSSVPQLHGTQTPATLHNFTPPLISPSSP